MFDFVHEKKRLVQIVLLLMILPFAFWGVESYRKSGGGEALATVNGEKIHQQEYDTAVRQQQERMRETLKDQFDASVFDKPDVKHAILDNLVSQHILTQQARSAGMRIGDDILAQVIGGIEVFHKDGKFDKQQYESVLRGQNLTGPLFEERVRQELATRQLTDGYTQNGYASISAADKLIYLNEQQRVVSVALVTPDTFLKQATTDDAAIKAYYDKNTVEFQLPEQARVEYVTFSSDALQGQVTVSDTEIKKYYDEHQPEFGEQEQRQAAHILIAAAAQASDAEKQAAKAKAEQILQQIRQSPGKFAELAKQNSQDPGSAVNGGDLGLFGRGMMVKPFEAAVFKLKPGEVSDLVQTDYGYHIIKLVAIKPGKVRTLEEMKSSVILKLKQQKANDQFAEQAEKFGNTVYEQSDTLKPAADLVKVPVQQSTWLSKGQAGALPWTAKALQAVFTHEVLQEKRNSVAVEVAPNTLLAARLLEYRAASARPLAEVSDAIRQRLLRQQAQELAVKQGQQTLEQLRHGVQPNLAWKSGQTVTRGQRANLDVELIRQVFQADAAQLPGYAGAESVQGGYMLVRVDAIKEAPAPDDAKRARYIQQLRQLTSEQILQAYLADSKQHADIKIKGFSTDAK